MRYKAEDDFETERAFVKNMNFRTNKEIKSIFSGSLALMFLLVSTVIVAQIGTSLLGSHQGENIHNIHRPILKQQISKPVKHKFENDEKCGITPSGQV